MTDNNKVSGFWTTLPGILTGIAGLLGGIVAIMQVVKASPAPGPASLTHLEVEAKSPDGTLYSNKGNKALNLRYKATKSYWVAIPKNHQDDNLPEEIKGDISLDGISNFVANNGGMKCPGFPLGALIIFSEKHGCLTSGAESQFQLLSGDTVHFLMNDVRGLYKDNEGRAEVDLYKDS